ncbi:GNAT family N-acetyltransferase [Streptomyces olivaceus]|uniref:GNAT family N-acetyltransferase n=1 Tax=Streptomyces olivaceus TaxID=47716 RepID=UPI000A50703E|nr:GNAT family N-acetyltransferase [Streptomyces olivaceus]MBZ6102973.1 GNAT family N-acetyltransferase [Streptomyces olivaceus]
MSRDLSDVTDALTHLFAHGPAVPAMLLAPVAALIATAGIRTRWSQRHGQAPPPDDTGARPPGAEAEAEASALWRMRTTVRDAPGSLAALCAALADRRIDILSLQTHPLAEGTVDEFLLRAPGELAGSELTELVTEAGGAHTWTERADAHDLVDAPTRLLGLATRTALDAAELPLALRQLLGRCTIRSLPASTAGSAVDDVPPQGTLEDTVLRLRAPEGGVISVERPYLPFTPAEFARARALVELDARLGPRLPRGRDELTLSEGRNITVRRADTRDVEAAKAMHERCSARTLGMRYHGPVGDADRYLNHLLSPRFGRTLAVQTASGRIVGLGHLLWDGDETEVALLVEDAWQRRGVGAELLGRLVAMAAETGCESVYAVTQASNTGMVAAMRGLGLPLDYQIEEGTLVVTARLTPASPAAVPLPHAERIGTD